MLDNIRRHSFVVAKITAMLACDLNKTAPTPGHLLSFPLVVAGALLHDIGKTQCLNTDRNHAAVGAEICRMLGFDAIAEIVLHHVILPENQETRLEQGLFSAEEIVYYADKRVNHENIVPLETRLAYILQRYGQGDRNLCARIHDNFKRCQRMERYIFSRLSYQPDDLTTRLATLSWLHDFFACAGH